MNKLLALMKKLSSETNQNSLSDLMHEGILYAEENNIINLKTWLHRELNGFKPLRIFINYDPYKNEMYYRLINYQAKNLLGIDLRPFFGASMPDTIVFSAGVIEAEKCIKYNQPLIDPYEATEDLFSKDWTDLVYRVKFQPKDLEATLQKIRIEYTKKIKHLITEIEINLDSPKKVYENVKSLIVNDDIEDALLLIAKEKPNLENDTILLLSKLSNVRKQFINGTIKQDDYQIELSRIKSGVIGMLDLIKDNNEPNP